MFSRIKKKEKIGMGSKKKSVVIRLLEIFLKKYIHIFKIKN